jgi:fumarate reductase iron-sulfur subunit
MQINILRSETNTRQAYTLPDNETTLLNALTHIKATQDATLTFAAGCRASVCGTCSVRVNGREELACAYKVKDGDVVEPLNYHPVLRDLKVDKNKTKETLLKSSAWLHNFTEVALTPKDEKLTETQTDCILCDSCYSACPVLEVNPDFIGPFALTRVYRYTSDPREADIATPIANIQTNGIWDCTLCGECTAVCPQGIDPKMDINRLRGTASQLGYSDPNFQAMDFGFGGF